ncbi:MAG TPA: ribosome-associated translation inhibitor RaiA [Patescibacteria group bacterium]|nr:ribosome-associated translation inhibitor RaiA [Patescibacteria group bacterium]
MKLDITGRNIEITPAIRDFTQEKLSKLDKWLDEVDEAHVVLFVEKHRHKAEIVVKGRHHTLAGTDETGDMFASIGNAVEKIEKQARREKDKDSGRRKHAKSTARISEIVEPAPEGSDDGHRAARRRPRVIRSNDDFKMKPMSVEDATMQFVDSEREFLVYRDARSQRISVMYRRKDGHLGLIEPEG